MNFCDDCGTLLHGGECPICSEKDGEVKLQSKVTLDCRHCNSENLETLRTEETSNDREKELLVRCNDCRHVFSVVISAIDVTDSVPEGEKLRGAKA